MDIILLVLSILLIIVGLLGCILPVIPGPPISFIGLLIVHFTKFASFGSTFLILMASLAILVTVLDYVVPIWGTKRLGGTKSGMWGATIGLVIGLFFGPIGIIFGPLIGAIIGETIRGAKSQEAFRAGFGAFLGFLMGVGIKLAASIYMTYHFVKAVL